jgi:L-ascorbate metabolism protein UlaG (beta-lactamase superfamily)
MARIRFGRRPARHVLVVRPTALIGTVATAAGAVWLGRALRGLPLAMGASSRRIARAAADAPQFADGEFRNTIPTRTLEPGTVLDMSRAMAERGDRGKPSRPIPLATPEIPTAAGDLAATWFGHASVLLELDGARILLDPVWGERVSPSPVVGPARMHPVPIALTDLPPIDAVVISHDHYDHLDLPTVRTLLRTQRAPFLVPRGVGEHLRRWRVPEDRIIELDWDGTTQVAGITVTCTESRHFSGRGLKRNTSLWSSWAFTGPRHRVFFGGDTGYTPAFAEIGQRLGPFDLTILPIGAYGPSWPHIHLDPEEAVKVHLDLGGDAGAPAVLLPIHWATFDLALHAWGEPIERLLAAAGAGIPVVTPRPGARIDLGEGAPSPDPWWVPVAG